MRIWSLHPKYLDRLGLLAVWRETLLAKKVLENKTKGYKNHPQLIRFKNQKQPLDCINYYLKKIFEEAKNKNYNFNISKFEKLKKSPPKISINSKQLEYEFSHLLKKLKLRSPKLYQQFKNEKTILTHSLFKTIKGPIESWEKVQKPH